MILWLFVIDQYIYDHLHLHQPVIRHACCVQVNQKILGRLHQVQRITRRLKKERRYRSSSEKQMFLSIFEELFHFPQLI